MVKIELNLALMSNLICHYHEMTISQAFSAIILLSMLQTKNLLYVLDFCVIQYLLMVGFSDIQQFTPQGKHTIVVPPYYRYTSHLYSKQVIR